VGGVLSERAQRWAIFGIALAVRLAVAFVFFGSVDVTNSMLDAERLLAGIRPSELTVPYFPGVQALIWAAGVISVSTAVPVAFLYKVFGCLFDGVIAALIADVRGRRAGLLYAFAPVPILIVSIHGQWDAISLAFFMGALLVLRREGNGAAIVAGALCVLSVIAKPITIPFLLFLFDRKRGAALAGGMAAAFAAYVAALWAVGDPLNVYMVTHVLDYARRGVTYFGLPHGLGTPENRLVMLLPIVLLLPLHWRGRIGREDAILLSCAWILGTCGLAAQYLSWLVPFLLLKAHLRFAAVYSLIAGLWLALFYVTPGAGVGGVNFANLGAFAPLRQVAWLTPPVAGNGTISDLLRVAGNFAVPLCCLALIVFLVRRRPAAEPPLRASLGPIAAAVTAAAFLIVAALLFPGPEPEEFRRVTHQKVQAYNVVPFVPPAARPGEPVWVIPAAVRNVPANPVHAGTIAIVWIVIWSCAAYLTGARTHPYMAT
jgi:hypothetical protein